MSDWREHIVEGDPVLLQKPAVRGTEIAVGTVVDEVIAGGSIQSVLASHPELTLAAVLACIEYSVERLETERRVAEVRRRIEDARANPGSGIPHADAMKRLLRDLPEDE